MLQGVCDELVTTQAYEDVWIYHACGNDRGYHASQRRDDANSSGEPNAARYCRAADVGESGVRSIRDPLRECPSCPLVQQWSSGLSALAARIEYDGVIYGTLCAAVSREAVEDPLQKHLFEEVRADLGFALAAAEERERRREAERAHRESERRFRLLYEDAPIAYQAVDAAGVVITVNNAWLQATGYRREEVEGRPLIDFIVPAEHERFRECFSILKRDGASHDKEFHLLNAQQQERTVSFEARTASPDDLAPGSDAIEQVHCVFLDVTERRRAEHALQQSLEEQEALLREVHHRVRNNLNIIISLMNLSSESLRSTEDAVQAFGDTESRIRAIAMVHGKLYESGDAGNVFLPEYVHDLAHQLLVQHQMTERVALSLQVDDMYMDLSRAILLGLVLNEAVGNAFDHAFPDGRSGSVAISCTCAETSGCTVEIRDDGVGFDENQLQSAGDSLGFALMYMLTDQLEGSLEVQGRPSGAIQLSFPLPAAGSR